MDFLWNSTATSSNTKPEAMTPDKINRMISTIKSIEESQAKAFREAVIKIGCDLDDGYMMLVPKAFDLSMVPAKYRDVVAVNRLDDRIYFIKV